MTERVLIAGMGPVGVVAATILTRAGIPVTLFEAQADLPTDLRASTFHPPTLDMLHALDLAEPLVADGLIASTYQWRDRATGEAATFDLGCLAGLSAFPFRLQCEQFKLTRLATERLANHPLATLHFASPIAQVAQNVDKVTVTLDDGRTFDGAYLVGADGASSAVREALGISFTGFTYAEQWVVASTPVDIATKIPNLAPVTYTADPDDWFVLLRTKDLWRVLIPVAEAADADRVLSDAFIQNKLQSIARHENPYDITHRTLYRVHQRIADTYCKGRAALAGDAAHINNPLGGMGMNGGIHDAVDLANKLVQIINHGAAPEPLLEHYAQQRHAIAEEYVLTHTHQNKQVIEERDPVKRKAHLERLKHIATTPEAHLAHVRRGAMIDAVEKSMSLFPAQH